MTFIARTDIVTAGPARLEIRYPELDLETLKRLPRYHDWIIEQFALHLGGRVAEVGAGLGTVAERLLPWVDALDLVEPASNLLGLLEEKFAGRNNVRVISESLEIWLKSGIVERYDGIVMVNVLEHIEDDLAALVGLRRALKPGGKLLVFVPALPFLFSQLDRIYGHYRRYTRAELVAKVCGAGFGIVHARYFDFVGILPWWLLNTVMGKTEFNPFAIRIFDSLFVPVSRFAENIIPPPIGKNVLLIAERPVDGS